MHKLNFDWLKRLRNHPAEMAEFCSGQFIEQTEMQRNCFFRPKFCDRTWENDAGHSNLVHQGFCKPNGAFAWAYWCPTNIMTNDYEATVSFQLAYSGDDLKLVDLMDGSVYRLPESICQKDAFGTWTIAHCPVKDYPMLIVCGDF